jgi:putative heme-binding domain-containing protein
MKRITVATAGTLFAGVLSATGAIDEISRHAIDHPGDPARGRERFEAAASMCAGCHSIDGSSSKVGPDLAAIGDKFNREGLVRAIVEPGKDVAIGYAIATLTLKDGSIRSGVVKSVTADETLLMGADGTTSRIPAAEVAGQKTENLSLMPPGLHQAMGKEGFADLIAYLATLRAPAGGGGISPETIPRARVPATLEPLMELRFEKPTLFEWVPGTEGRAALVLEHEGAVRAVEGIGATAEQRLFLDLRGRVKPGGATGLLGLAFHPGFTENRRYVLQYQVMEDGIVHTLLEERRMIPGRIEDSGEPAREILRIRAATLDHCGGTIAFGRDGFLWFGMGDTGPHRDPQGNGQAMGHLLGKILRIDIDRRDGPRGYAIPADNPFLGRAGVRPEIWATGFRNPYRFSWDRETGDLWVGDVGQDRYDEVAIVRRGENHGWNVYEGHEVFSEAERREGESYTAPVLSYARRHGVSVTGGQVYRGQRAPVLAGWYVFGDYESRRIWALRQRERKLERIVEIARAPSRITSFTAAEDGELVLTGFDDGVVRRLRLDAVDPSPGG